ncbi:MAG: choice-of-anchor D domain-containing protein [Solirubrobacterales bacterium]
MLSIRQKSKPARTTFILLGFAIALLALMATRPAAGLAAPPEPVEPPQLSVEPGSYDFGLHPLNWGSTQTYFQLRNAGAEAFQISSGEITGPGSGAFSTGYSNCYGTTLQPGESCSAQVYFGPYDAVEYNAQFRVNVGSYSFSADLSGTGGRATFAPAANPTDFGVAKVGSAGTIREITISNTGNMPGGMFIAVIAGGAIGSFQIIDENCTGVEIAPAATCTVQVRFQPASEGVKKATLGLFGENEGPTPIVLTGVGSAPDPVASTGATGVAGTAAFDAASQGSKASKRKRRPGLRKHRRKGASVQSARLVLKAR